MACNENVIKNMANEIARNCQAKNLTVDTDFVIYMIELLLLNPKYGKLFSKTISRSNLEFFVNECVSMLIQNEAPISTLKIQFLMKNNYDKPPLLIGKHLDSIENCLRPLINEILEQDPDPENEGEFKKLFRKISVYIILSSGLGNPGVITTLKEGIAALESVFSMDDLMTFVTLSRKEKLVQLHELTEIVSGVRLFNRDCKKGGDTISDLPILLVDAGKACLASLSNSLITIMQRVNSLTTSIDDTTVIQKETGNVITEIHCPGVTMDDFKRIIDLISFCRQFELVTRHLLSDIETVTLQSVKQCETVKVILQELHAVLKYKSQVPTTVVFPLFIKLWKEWRSMQNLMYLVSTVNKLMATLCGLREPIKFPYKLTEKLLKGRHVLTDQDRMIGKLSMEERLSLVSLMNYKSYNDSICNRKKTLQYCGFCAVCVCVGALVPGNVGFGVIKELGQAYAFCSVHMAAVFGKCPPRYIKEAITYVRNNPHLIHLLNMFNMVDAVKEVDVLVARVEPKIMVNSKEIQTETHPIESHIDRDYTWDMWEWKRRACQWASIVNCKTHSTQTIHSHMRSSTHCQTVMPRDAGAQTKQDTGVNTRGEAAFLWGLRGQTGYGQHAMDLTETDAGKKLTARAIARCWWACDTFGETRRHVRIDNSDATYEYDLTTESSAASNFSEGRASPRN